MNATATATLASSPTWEHRFPDGDLVATDRSIPRTDLTPNQPVLMIGPEDRFEQLGVTRWVDSHGWPSTWAAEAGRAKWLVCIQRISAVLVALDEPEVPALVDAIRPVTNSPIVVLGDLPSDRVVALLAAGVDAVIDPSRGADDVFARVKALLRRVDESWEPGVRYLVADGLRVDLWSQQCETQGTPLHLSPTEYALLVFLMSHPNQALTSNVIVRRVWGWPPSDGRNALRIFVNRLRRKLGDDPGRPTYIESIRGTGYRFLSNVTEVGEASMAAVQDSGATLLLVRLEQLALRLLSCRSVSSAAEEVLTCLDETGYADAIAVFRVDGPTMNLVGQRHAPKWWLDQVGPGVPLRPSFASAHSVMTGQTVAFGDVATSGGRYASTAERLLPGDFHACLFVPVQSSGRVWGHIGLVRRARQPYDETGTSFLRSVAATLGLVVDRLDQGCTTTPQ